MSDNIVNLDGRTARRAGSRRKLLIAGLRLIEKGTFRLQPQDIADKASMHRRSLYDIFGDMDGYLEELLADHEASIRAVIEAEVKKGKSLSKLVLMGK